MRNKRKPQEVSQEQQPFFIILWEGQTCFGPFKKFNEAIEWAESFFSQHWNLLNRTMRCIAVEPVPKGPKFVGG